MPEWVCTASIYVEADTPDEATQIVETQNIENLNNSVPVHIRLPDNVLLGPDSWDEGDYIWEETGPDPTPPTEG